MTKALLITALSATMLFSGATVSPLRAEAPIAAESLEVGSAKITVDGKTYDGSVALHNSDYVKAGMVESVTVAFRPTNDSPLMMVIISFSLMNGKLSNTDPAEINAMVRGGGFLFSVPDKEAPKVELSKVEQRGDKLFVAGTASSKVYFSEKMTERSTDESKAKQISVVFATEAAPL